MATTNIIRKTHHLFILGMALGACNDLGPDRPGAGLEGMESSGALDDGDGADGDDGADGGGSGESGGDPALDCGNGVVEAGEDCDDDNDDDLDSCLSDCRFGPRDILIDDSSPEVLAQHGNLGGGKSFDDGCPNGEVITGILGRQGVVIDQIQVECGVVQLFHPDEPEVLDLAVVPGTTLPARGFGLALGSYATRCPEDHAVVGFGGNSGASMEKIVLSCAHLSILDDGTSLALGFGEPFDLDAVGDGGGEFEHAYCEDGQVATIANIRSGVVVDAFGLTCMPIGLLF
jgi:hypothetical protein